MVLSQMSNWTNQRRSMESCYRISKRQLCYHLLCCMYLMLFYSSLCTSQLSSQISTDNIPTKSWHNCSLTMFTCTSGKTACIQLTWKCDGDDDCDDGSDEHGCSSHKCNEKQLKCGDSDECISLGWLCDGDRDCGNGFDEDPNYCDADPMCKYYGAPCLSQPTTCVAYDRLCDGVIDCPDDGSDEGAHCDELVVPGYSGPSQCNSLKCSYKCTILPSNKAACYCKNGSSINQHNKTCEVKSPCSVMNNCEQICTNRENGWEHTCSCHKGFFQDLDDSHLCFVAGTLTDAYALVSSDHNIWNISLHGVKRKEVIYNNTISRISCMDYNPLNHQFCWIAVNVDYRLNQFICSVLTNVDSLQEIHLPYSLQNIEQFAMDWLTGNVYMVDGRDERIFVCNTTSVAICVTVIQENNHADLFGIAVDPFSGYMFYTDHGTYPALKRADMDGSKHKIIVSTRIVFPRVLTVDIYGKRVFFADAHNDYIQSVNYDGLYSTMIIASSAARNMYGLAYFNGSLFGTVLHNKSVAKIDVWSSDHTAKFVANGIKHPGSIKVVHSVFGNLNGLHHGCTNLHCEQLCLLKSSTSVAASSSGVCKCQAGYTLDKDGRTCAKPSGEKTFLLYSKSSPGEIKGISLFLNNSNNYAPILPIENLQNPRAMDYYRDGNGDDWVVISDITMYQMAKTNIRNAQQEVIFDTLFHDCEGLAVDWMSGNVYWTDDGYKTVNVANLTNPLSNPSHLLMAKHDNATYLRKILVHGNMTHPRAIAVNPSTGWMYWSVWKRRGQATGRQASIEKAWMDGSHRETLVTGPNMLWPNGITIDYERHLLFWVEAYYDRIEYISLQPPGHRVLVLSGNFNGGHHLLSDPMSVTLHDFEQDGNTTRYLYWSEYRSGNILRLDLSVALAVGPINIPDSAIQLVAQEKSPLLEVMIFDPSKRNGTNSCSSSPCSDLCVPIPKHPHYACLCPDHREFTGNNFSCSDKTNYTTPYSCHKDHFECNNGLCIPKKWLCDNDNDCLDGSDETSQKCVDNNCTEGRFKCLSAGLCISSQWVCDGDADCQGGEDESPVICKSRTCPAGQFLCSNGYCIPDIWKCDLDDDCRDGSDEMDNCSYSACRAGVQFTCANKKCISVEWRCDQDDDCGDGSDEAGCQNPTVSTPSLCSNSESFVCHNDSEECILAGWECDGDRDCMDGSDEQDCANVCPPNIHSCGPGRPCKILSLWLCDGEAECQNGWDENNCECPANDKDDYKQIRCLDESNLRRCVDVCDGVKDCLDATDEANCTFNGTCVNAGCSHFCDDSRNGFRCYCPKGKKLSDDRRTCLDGCSARGRCSQICQDDPLSYRCSCYYGWHTDPGDPTQYTCLYDRNDPPPFLIFSNVHALRYLLLDFSVSEEGTANRKSEHLVSNTRWISSALDFHYWKQYLFYTDVTEDTVSRATLYYNNEDSSLHAVNKSVIISDGLGTPEGIAVDWLADRLYFADSAFDQIEATDLDGQNRSLVLAGGLSNPRALCLDPRYGLLFWTDWEKEDPRVERATMAGENRAKIWSSAGGNGGWPNGLTVDYLEQRLYWADARSDTIYSSRYDGSDLFSAVWGTEWLSHPYALTMYSDHLIWTNWRTTVIATAPKWPGRNSTVIELSFSQPFDIKVYHESRQPLTASTNSQQVLKNPCAQKHCDGLCVISPNSGPIHQIPQLSYKCLCPQMHFTAPDGHSCLPITTFLVFSRGVEIRSVRVDDLNISASYAISAPLVYAASRLALHTPRHQVFWSDVNKKEIRAAFMDESGEEMVIETEVSNVYGLVVDWIRDKVYWTSYYGEVHEGKSNARLTVSTLDGRLKHRLEDDMDASLWSTINRPRYLTADVTNGVLYFASDEGVFTVDMDGKGLTKISPLNNVTDLRYSTEGLLCAHNATLYRLENSHCDDYWCEHNLNLRGTVLSSQSNYTFLYDPIDDAVYEVASAPSWKRILRRKKLKGVTDMAVYDPTQYSTTQSLACVNDNGGCEQLCLPSPQSNEGYVCRCTMGFQPTRNNHAACEGIRDFLLYTSAHSISGLSFDGDPDTLAPIPSQILPTGVDFFAGNDTIVWVDTAASLVKAGTRNGSSQWIVFSPYVQAAKFNEPRHTGERYEGISVDWMAQNVYWTDPGADMVKVVRLNGSFVYNVYKGGQRLRGIAAHPNRGWLFVSDWGDEAGIIRMKLDGSEAKHIVRGLGWPNGLTLDYEADVMYWCDAKRDIIQSARIDGSALRNITKQGQSRTYGITFFQQTLFWTDSQKQGGSIKSYNMSTGRSKTLLDHLSIRLKDIVVYSPRRQIGANLCSRNNGGCEQLCFYLGGAAFRCACAYGRLNEDNRTCRAHDRYILYSFRTVIHSINVEDPSDINEPMPIIENPNVMKSVVAMAMDFTGGRIFYSDITKGNIYSIKTNYDGMSVPDNAPVVADVGTVEGLAYHRGQDALYWTSYNDKTVKRYFLSKQTGSNLQIIVPKQSDNDRLRALVLFECSTKNYVFWTNWNENNASVMRATTNGGAVRPIISTRVATPNALTIDITVRQLYWADATLDKIERCDFDGQNRQVILTEGLVHVFSLALLGRHLYWSDWQREEILRVDKTTGHELQVMRNLTFLNLLGVLAVYNDSCQPNPCLTTHCDYVCEVVDNNQAVCICPDGSSHCNGSQAYCSKDGFACDSSSADVGNNHHQCISYAMTCDGVVQCPNGADEEAFYCTRRRCRSNYWMCGNGRCIPNDDVCDGRNDCGDGTDESGEIDCDVTRGGRPALPCKDGMFTCEDGRCIPITWSCDGEDDCTDGSDERCNRTCHPNNFQCKTSFQCIPSSYRCDGEPDCSDGSDENKCGNKCRDGFFPCTDHKNCIPLSWACDGEDDCGDGSDELSCGVAACANNEFRCSGSGKCITTAWRCDRDHDCEDGSDEAGCDYPPCNSTEFKCTDGECISRDWLCDSDPDCDDGSDEKNCSASPACDKPTHIRCGDGACLSLNKTCDGVRDCNDAIDERNCHVNECESKGRNNCRHICEDRAYSYVCKCKAGYQLQEDGYSCSEVDECSRADPYLPCSQICKNKREAYTCSCAAGYHKDPHDSSNCKASALTGPPYLLVTNRHYVSRIGVTATKVARSILHSVNPNAIDFDWSEQELYWSSVERGRSVIKRISFNKSLTSFLQHINSSQEVVLKMSANSVEGLAVDWIARNLYWSDRESGVIEVSKLDGGYRKVIIDSGLHQPYAIAVNPLQGYLYWTDVGGEAHIGRIGMDGSARDVLINERRLSMEGVTQDRVGCCMFLDMLIHELQTNPHWPGKKLVWPSGLTIDYAAEKLFWADAVEDYIAHCDLNGQNAQIVVKLAKKHPSMPARFGPISVFEDRLYWVNTLNRSIDSVHKYRGNYNGYPINRTFLHFQPQDVKVVHQLRQPQPDKLHRCAVYNGGCSNLCLVTPGGGARCGCPNNFYLAKDGRTCISNCSYSEFVCASDKCIPYWWKCDGVDDCGDQSDEPTTCGAFYCLAGQFQCNDSSKDLPDCINPAGLCDGYKECADGSDEHNCDEHVCLSGQFKCEQESRCIFDVYRCDGEVQCAGGEDEINCPPPACEVDQFACKPPKSSVASKLDSLTCIPKSWVCDGDDDCEGGSDESKCASHSCKDSEMKCQSYNVCISKAWLCDGENDCRDASDEKTSICANKTCGSSEWKCKNNLCVPARWLCDGDNDCGDGSDELRCDSRSCGENHFRCKEDQRCVLASFQCDGELDCVDNSDEAGCPDVHCTAEQFRCENPSKCIPLILKCDGVTHCVNGTDEKNCSSDRPALGPTCPDYMFTCIDGSCIPQRWKCDGQGDCFDGSDEGPVCVTFQCPQDRPFRCEIHDVCIPLSKVCDGVRDCHGDSDESAPDCQGLKAYLGHSTNASHCRLWRKSPTTRFDGSRVGEEGLMCDDMTCVPLTTLCDGVATCPNGKDEKYCMRESCSSTSPVCTQLIKGTCKTLPLAASGGFFKSYCACNDGYQLLNGECEDVDECQSSYPCSQICTNTPGSFHCSCESGWRQSDHILCRMDPLTNPPAKLMLISGFPPIVRTYGDIDMKILSSDSEMKLTSSNIVVDRMVPVPGTEVAYWMDSKQASIYEGRSERTSLIFKLEPSSRMTGLALDWGASNLYVTDVGSNPSLRLIQVQQTTSRTAYVIYNQHNSNIRWPLDVAVCIEQGILFVADGGSNSSGPSILKLPMLPAYGQQQVLVSHDVEWPISITVDIPASRVYWADSKLQTISSINYDGSGRRLVRRFGAIRPLTIVLFGDYIFCTTCSTHGVFRIHKLAHTLPPTNNTSPHRTFIPFHPFFSFSTYRNVERQVQHLYWVEFAASQASIYVSGAVPAETFQPFVKSARQNCSGCVHSDSLCVRTQQGYQCKCPKHGPLLTDLLDCSCINVTCVAGEQCINGSCRCASGSICATGTQPGAANVGLPTGLGLLLLLAVITIALLVLYKRRKIANFRRQGATSRGLTYRELAASEDTLGSDARDSPVAEDGNHSEALLPVIDADEGAGEQHEDVATIVEDRIIYKKRDRDSEEGFLLSEERTNSGTVPDHHFVTHLS